MDEPLVKSEVADSEPQRRPGPWKLIIIVIVLTLIGVWLVPGDGPGDDPTVTKQPAGDLKHPDASPAPGPSLLTDAAPAEQSEALLPAEPGIIDDTPGARARALITRMRSEGAIDPDRVIAAARQAQIAGELADAYLLYFYAAREGSTAAALELGRQADPASRDPLSSVFESPDYNQAHKWFQVAATGGNEEARDRLMDLHKRVEQLAASGDPQAQRISLLWK